jgi:6-phosphogluconolactonase (cycloisomerase 2 family)
MCAGCPIGEIPNPGKTTPTVTWATPAAITYGTALSSAQLNATASVPGTFAYTPAAGTLPNAGSQTLSATFTPTDTTKYNSASGSVTLTVNKATPTITWPAPAAITQGTALSATQLDATASVAGTFAYTPASGTALNAGTQTLSVTFTPTDSTNYNSATGSVSITVNASASGIGPAGGTVNGFYGASVTVPAGALSSNVDIQIPRDDTGAPTIPSTGIDISGAMYALTPHGTAFSTSATVKIPFDSDLPTDAAPVLYKAEPGGAFAPILTTVNGNFLSANVANFSWVIPGYAATLPRMVYGLSSGNTGLAVSSFKIAKGTVGLSAATSSAPVGTGAISITVHPSRRFLYVTNSGSGAAGTATNVLPNSVSVYQLDAKTGAVSGPTDTKVVNGHPIAVVVHPTGKFIYVVNEARFGSPIGNISVFSIDQATGALTGPITTGDSGGAPATAVAFPPSGEFAYVTYMHATSTPAGNSFWDTVKTYTVNKVTGEFSASPISSAPTGDNAWALAVTPGGHFAYVGSLSNQGSVSQLSLYSINQSTGVLTLQNTFGTTNAPGSLAMDPLGRFLYVGLQGIAFVSQLNANVNLEVYSINASSGALTLKSGVATSNNPGAPIAVTAEPQGQFVYALDDNGEIVPYSVSTSSGTLSPGPPITGVFPGGATGGVGDPFSFAASGTSPVWQDNCTIVVDGAFVFDGCPVLFMSSGPGSTSGNGGGSPPPPPPPAANFVLTVVNTTAGGYVVSSPSGIDTSPTAGGDFFQHAFPSGGGVTLTATPPDTANVYDITWSGSCHATGATAGVTMTQDQTCYVSFTNSSLR